MHLRLCHRPRWGSLQRSPSPLARLRGPTSKGRGKGEGKEACLTSAGGEIKAPVRQHHTLARGALMRPIVTLSPIGERSIVMSASVCLSAAIISSELHARCSLNFFCMLAMAVARSSSDSVVICYAFPVLRRTSHLHIS